MNHPASGLRNWRSHSGSGARVAKKALNDALSAAAKLSAGTGPVRPTLLLSLEFHPIFGLVSGLQTRFVEVWPGAALGDRLAGRQEVCLPGSLTVCLPTPRDSPRRHQHGGVDSGNSDGQNVHFLSVRFHVLG